MHNHDLSVVIISRNEEKNIARCIESVLRATKDIDNPEIIMVDSVSSDKTIEIAMRYPIKILQMDNSLPLSAAAGRYIGFLYSRGRYIQFQDGDTTLNENWFANAIPVIERNSSVAGVVGIITQEIRKWEDENLIKPQFGELKAYHEDILLKREALLESKPFNPYLKAVEEGELSARLIANGFKLLRLRIPMSHHYGGYKKNYSSDLRRKWVTALAYGQILRYSLRDNKVIYQWIREYKFFIIFSVLILSSVFFIAFAYLGYSVPLYIWILSWLILFADIFYEKKQLKYALNHIISIAVRWPYFVWGFLQCPKDPSEYPRDVKIIKN